ALHDRQKRQWVDRAPSFPSASRYPVRRLRDQIFLRQFSECLEHSRRDSSGFWFEPSLGAAAAGNSNRTHEPRYSQPPCCKTSSHIPDVGAPERSRRLR